MKGGRRKDDAVAVNLESVPAGLDWDAFSAEYFPESRRHNLQAIVAYAAYKRSRVAGEQAEGGAATHLKKAEGTPAGGRSVERWEDEGGALQ